MKPLEKTLRNQLEHAIKEARDVAEAAARAALEQLGVGGPKPYEHLSDEQRQLRLKLRAHGRQLGNGRKADGSQELGRLIEEVAYEHWHRMLFARFLAENNLLMYPDPDEPVAVTLEECDDLARDEGAVNGWELAARFAARMLPQIFRLDSPVFQLTLPPEHQQKLERLVADLPLEVFTASDSLGWVYQFWQAKKKDEVNASEVKIGARELPAVTQLFTEPYMVSFLLDNSLGAWWVARRLTESDLKNASSEEELRCKASIPGVPLDYLRFIKSPSPSGRGGRGEGKEDKKTPIPDDLLENARKLRQNQTDAEQLLWSLLRNRRFADKKFRRQHPVGRYILDFYCHELKLAIELDGGQHNEPPAKQYDADRTSYLEEQGIRVIRFWNNEVLQQTDSVLESLWNSLTSLTPAPLPEGEGLYWQPAAGTFDGWPEQLSGLKTLDPCCGSGHFLVAAFLMLVPMRMELEELSAREAVDAVLRDNIHGLELDQRCVELAAFALALTAWKYPDLPSPSGRGAGGERPIGYRPLPELNVACSGLAISAKKEEWLSLAGDNTNLRIGLEELYKQFKDAPVLGSLINPESSLGKGSLFELSWEDVGPLLARALADETDDQKSEMGIVARGMAKAAKILADEFFLVSTNVPYLTRSKFSAKLRDYTESFHKDTNADLATAMIDRFRFLIHRGGALSVVSPQNWLFQSAYKTFRRIILSQYSWRQIAKLGFGSFNTPLNAAPSLFIAIKNHSLKSPIYESDAVNAAGINAKKEAITSGPLLQLKQGSALTDQDFVLDRFGNSNLPNLSASIDVFQGIRTGDKQRFTAFFWEVSLTAGWDFMQSTCQSVKHWDGLSQCVHWVGGNGQLHQYANETRDKLHDMHESGNLSWGKRGVTISQMGNLESALYSGEKYDGNCATITPRDVSLTPAIWSFCSSSDYQLGIRAIDQSIKVTNATLGKVPFDELKWVTESGFRYPNGLPKPYSDDPTQWIFHGHPCGSVVWDENAKWTAHGPLRTDDTVLQVAVARLLAYRWPAELDADKVNCEAREGALGQMELADEQREWVNRCEALSPTPLPAGEGLIDEDGIVCIPPVRGEATGNDRLLNLLAAAYNHFPSPSGRGVGGEGFWSNDILAKLLKSADHAGKTLETWLRDKFFAQHCKLFHHRPFIWHIWDGLPDGFAALVNYHKFDHKLLETLIYTYLGDWIIRQKQDIASSVDGAEEKLAAAESLKKKLELILEGEAPYDIFVRWKPLSKQPIGWNPDLNDGVRLNIRPFITVPDVKKKGAGVLRDKPNTKWNKDRGKDVGSAPWYHLFKGDRINDHHLSMAEKHKAQREAGL